MAGSCFDQRTTVAGKRKKQSVKCTSVSPVEAEMIWYDAMLGALSEEGAVSDTDHVDIDSDDESDIDSCSDIESDSDSSSDNAKLYDMPGKLIQPQVDA